MSNSDYSKIRTNLFELLPEVYRSAVNESLLETAFNRFLTKTEILRKIGFIGQGNPRAQIDRQIVEPTPHRQAYQLQPVIYSQIGSIEHMATSKDIFNELERLGVDIDRMKEWGDALSFNWAPPINYDKLINFQNYFWENTDNLIDTPQYLTIENPCTKAKALLSEYELTKTQFTGDGSSTLVGCNESAGSTETEGAEMAIIALNSTNKTFTVVGDKTLLFVENFVFYVKKSINTTINNMFFVTDSSTYEPITNRTHIVLKVSASPIPFDDSIIDGVISLEELTVIYQAEVECACSGSVGWDGGQWDDSQIGSAIWNATFLLDNSHPTEAAWIAANGAPALYDVWYDTTTDELKQFSGEASPNDWVVVQTEFGAIVQATTGQEPWDQSNRCIEISTLNSWQEQNKWVHRNQVQNFTVARRAQVPIIEFIRTVQLNEWNERIYKWKYRAVPLLDDFADTTAEPNLFELAGIDSFIIEGTPFTEIVIDSKYGDLTNIFVPGYEFNMIESTTLFNNNVYTVEWSTYCSPTSDGLYQTRIKVLESFLFPVGGSPINGRFVPINTSLGDTFTDFHEHWLFDGLLETRAIDHQPENPMVEISLLPPPPQFLFPTGSPITNVIGNYSLSQYAQDLIITTDCFDRLDVVAVSGSPGSVWTLSGNHEDTFNNPLFNISKLIIQGDSGGGVNGEYTIVSSTDVGLNTEIQVVESIPSTVVGDGTGYVNWTLVFDDSLHNRTRYQTNELRIYIADERNFSYEEINSEGSPVTVGSPTLITTCDDFVNSVIIKDPISPFTRIRVEVGAAAHRDIGWENVLVRMTEDDLSFSNPNDLHCVSLVKYRKLEQVKSVPNQYPLYDLFDVEGESINQPSIIFGFLESQDEPIDPYVGRRIVHTDDRLSYSFEQFLVSENNGILYTYRDRSVAIQSGFWFDSDNEILYRWTGTTWDRRILTQTYADDGNSVDYCYILPIVSKFEPEEPWISINGMLWFNLNNNSIYVTDGSTWTLDEILTSNIIESKTDPTLNSIWRTGPDSVACEDKETYVPDYVDDKRNVVPVGDPDGDWEVPDQLYFNYAHENRKIITTPEIVSHFTSIIASQDVPPGFFGLPENLFHIVLDVNYGAGGLIKEFNDGYDSFISSIFIQNVNPLGLYEYAHDAYETSLNQIKEIFRDDITALLTNTEEEVIADLSGFIVDDVIEEYEQNDYANFVYGDSNTSFRSIDENGNVVTVGVLNWPATLPFVRLAHKIKPLLLHDEQLDMNNIRHHDGHISTVGYLSTNVNIFALEVITTPDTRVTNPYGYMGVRSTQAPPATFAAYESIFGETSACYWYHITSTERILYRMAIVRSSATNKPPPVTLPTGSFWYDVLADRLKTLVEIGSPFIKMWVNATVSPGLITEGSVTAWEVVDVNLILAEIILEVENRLYDAAPVLDELSFDIDGTLAEGTSPNLTDEYTRDAFNEFIAQLGIGNPFDNSLLFDTGNPFTWNYKLGVPQDLPPPLSADITYPLESPTIPYESGGTWQDVYQKRYRTPYPHLEPWMLQGYDSKPNWWDGLYADTTGTRRWTGLPSGSGVEDGMWHNILKGIVPTGQTLPNGDTSTGSVNEVQSYAFVSVNIDSKTYDGIYPPDSLFPPYWELPSPDYPPIDFVDDQVRSIFGDFIAELDSDSIGNDYDYNDAGLIEWLWRNASQYLYDELKVAFRLQPVRFIHQTLGEEYLEIACLQVSQRQQKVYAHQNAQFHGDLLEDNTVLSLQGTLQWYVNFNRFNGYDAGRSSNFRPMWTDWRTFLGYQFATFIDTESFLVSNKNFDLTTQDYSIRIKRSPGIEDHWLEAFNITLIQAPPVSNLVDDESQWVFGVTALNPIGRTLNYYATQSYIFDALASPLSNIMNVDDVYGRTLPWEDGDEVIVSSTEFLPSPLQADTIYYANIDSPTSFSLSAQQGGPVIEILSTGTGTHTVSNIARSFDALSGNGFAGNKIWYAYDLDRDLVLPLEPITMVVGIQNLINIIFGYAAYETEVENYRFNHEATDVDFDTTRVVNWQLEIERLINFVYGSRRSIQRRKNFFQFSASASPNVLNFGTITSTNSAGQSVSRSAVPSWTTGWVVNVFPEAGSSLPDPLLQGEQYYYIRIDRNTFQLALTAKNARNGIAIPITSSGTGVFFVQEVLNIDTSPTIEVNPFRNNIWIETPVGIVSDIFKGPFADVRTDELVYDQYGRRLPSDRVLPLRQDKLTRIVVQENIPNDVELNFSNLPYNDIHLGSAHLFVDGYEHVLLFNNYSLDCLIYDPFLGLNTSKFDVQFDRAPEFNLRPNLGGYVLLNQQDVDFSTSLIRNIEGQTEDLRLAYDSYQVLEVNDLVEEGRKTLGYDGPFDFLTSLNANLKSQFNFWRGFIQSKGSNNSITAFVNSRRFVSAGVDEFWAYMTAEFGSSQEFSLPELKLFTDDARSGEIRYHFIEFPENEENGFIGVLPTDSNRWYEFPNQTTFFEINGNMYFNTGIDFIDIDANDSDAYISLVASPDTAAYPYIYELPYSVDDVLIGVRGSLGGSPECCIRPNTTITIDSQCSVGSPLKTGIHFELINSKTIGFSIDPTVYNLRLYLIVPYESRHNPAKIRDVIEETTINDVILWDPARNQHYHNAINVIDLQNDIDPATLGNNSGSPYFSSYESDIINGGFVTPFADNFDPWGNREVGTTWLDTSQLGFVPYSDNIINPDIKDRLKSWGRLSDWGSYRIFQWTESDVIPSQYDLLAQAQEGNFAIDPRIRVTGRSRKQIYINLGTEAEPVWTEYKFETYEVGSKLYFDPEDVTFEQPHELVYEARGVLNCGGDPPTGTILETTNPSSVATEPRCDVESVTITCTEPFCDGSPLTLNDSACAEQGSYLPVGSPLRDETGSPLGSLLGSPQSDTVLVFDGNNFTVNQANYDIQVNTILVQTGGSPEVIRICELGTPRNPSARSSPVEIPMFRAYKNGREFVGENADSNDRYYYGVSLLDAATRLSLDLDEFTDNDFITLVKYFPLSSDIDSDFWGINTPFNTERVLINGVPRSKFYFWVEAKSVREEWRNKTVSLLEARQQLEAIPVPYIIPQNLQSPISSCSPDVEELRPRRYTQAILRNYGSTINADDRYVLRFTRDFGLRDDYEDHTGCDATLKTRHQEWRVFRKEQPFTLNRGLWDLMIEAIIGQTIDSLGTTTVRVPALDKELYDLEFNTATRIGFATGKAFCDGEQAWEAVLQYLQDGNNNFTPIDMQLFFETYDILNLTPRTPEDAQTIYNMMDELYKTFSFTNVNRIYFQVLETAALPFQSKYESLMKTSWVALNGIRVLEVEGIFDD